MSQGFRPGLRGVCKCGMRWKQTLTPALWTNLFMGAREREEGRVESQGFRPGLRGVCKCGMRWKQTLTPALCTNLIMGARGREEDPLRLAQFPTGLGTSPVGDGGGLKR